MASLGFSGSVSVFHLFSFTHWSQFLFFQYWTSAKKANLDTLTINPNQCVFCTDTYSSKNGKENPVTPNQSKIESVFTACRNRQDEMGRKRLSAEADKKNPGLIKYLGTETVNWHMCWKKSVQSQKRIKVVFLKIKLVKEVLLITASLV